MRPVCVPSFAPVQVLHCLSAAVSTRDALHDAARIDAGIFSADARTLTARYTAVPTVSGDTALYTASSSGDAVCWVLLLGDKHPFYSAAGVHTTFSAADLGVIQPAQVRLVLLVSIGTVAMMQQAALLSTRPSLYSTVGAGTALFGRYTARLSAVGIIGTYGHSSDNAANSTALGATVPL